MANRHRYSDGVSGRIQRNVGLFGLVAGVVGAGGACGNDATTSPSTIAVTSTAYVTIPARTTTTMAAPPPQAAAGVDDVAVATAVETSDDPTIERTHRIESGDYLLAIARDYGVPIDYIPEYNGWTDGVNHALVPGEDVRIPPSDWTPSAEGAEASTASPDSAALAGGGCSTYTIRAGDTPARVAAAHDVSVAELDAANQSTQNYRAFVVGVEIVIPC